MYQFVIKMHRRTGVHTAPVQGCSLSASRDTAQYTDHESLTSTSGTWHNWKWKNPDAARQGSQVALAGLGPRHGHFTGVTPEPFQVVEAALFLMHDVDHEIAEIKQNPPAVLITLHVVQREPRFR